MVQHETIETGELYLKQYLNFLMNTVNKILF